MKKQKMKKQKMIEVSKKHLKNIKLLIRNDEQIIWCKHLTDSRIKCITIKSNGLVCVYLFDYDAECDYYTLYNMVE